MASDLLKLGLSANRSSASDSQEDLLSQAKLLLSQGKPGEARALLQPYRSKSRSAAQFLDQLDSADQRQLAQKAEALLQSFGSELTEPQRAELRSLGQCGSAEEFFDGLYHFALARKQGDQMEIAGSLFAMLGDKAANSSVPEPIRLKAESEIKAINGQGALGQRLEFLGSRFVRDAADPRTIAPMLAGSLVYNVARASALGRFAMTAGEAWYTRGLGARVAATAIAFPLEVTVFSMGSRALSGNKQWDPASVGKDWLGAALTLGTLKAFGALGNRTHANLHGLEAGGGATRFRSLEPFNQFFLPQAASFAGMLAAHKLEEKFGLRPVVDDATTVTDTLVSLVSMSVGAHLGHRLLGPRFAVFEKEVEVRAEQHAQMAQNKSPEFLERLRAVGREAALAPMWMAMGMGGLGGGSGLPSRKPAAEGSKKTEKSPIATELLKSLKAHYADEPEAAEQFGKQAKYLAGQKGGHQALEVVRERFSSDPEAASDLLEAFGNLFRSQRGKGGATWMDLTLELNREAPQLLLPAVELAHEYQGILPQLVKSPEKVFGPILMLKDLSPSTAEAAIEYMAATDVEVPGVTFETWSESTGMVSRASLHGAIFEMLEKAQALSPEARRAVFQAWDPFLKESVDPRSNPKNVRASAWPWLLENPLRAQEITAMLRACATDRAFETRILKFRKLWKEAGREFSSFYDLISEFSGKSVSTVLDEILYGHAQWSYWVPARDAARMATDPRWVREHLAPEYKRMRSSSLALQDLSYHSEWLEFFSRFIKRSQEFPNLRAPNHYADWFAELALNFGSQEEIPWEKFFSKSGLSPEERGLLRDLIEEFRLERHVSSNPPPFPGNQEIASHLLGFPSRPGLLDKKVVSASNNQLVLEQIRQFLKMKAEQGRSDKALHFAKHVLESLNRLPVRHMANLDFMRSDLYLNILHGMGLAPEKGPSFLPLLKLDLEELALESPLNRGLALDRWIYRLKVQGHPQMERAVAMILEEVLKPPPRHYHNSFTTSSEASVLETLNIFWTPKTQEVLKASLQDPELLRTCEKIAGMVERYRQSQGVSVSERSNQKVQDVFYGGPRPHEIEHMKTEDLLLPAAEVPRLAGGEADPKTTTSDSTETALAHVMSRGALSTVTVEPNPETGLLQIDLGGGTKLSLWHAVAPLRSEEAARSRSDWDRRQDSTLHEIRRELGKLDREKEKLDVAAMIPVPKAAPEEIQANLTLAREADTLQAMMRMALGEDPEGLLLQQLGEAMSMRQGLDLIEMLLRQKWDGGIRLKNLRDLNSHLPNATSSDVILTSLGEKAPRILASEEGVTMPYRLHVSGIEWANDSYDPATQREGLFPVDPYQFGGITGASIGTEHSFFNSYVTGLLQSALKARLSDRKLFLELWNRYSESSMAGLKLLKDWGDSKKILNKEVHDLEDMKVLSASEVVRLVGLLERIPNCLNRPDAARIHFKPFGAGIVFLNAEGKPMEYVSYHPHLQTSGFQEVHYKTESDLSDGNLHAQEFLGERLLGKILDTSFEQSEGDLSVLEEKMFEFHRRFGVHLPLAMRIAGETIESMSYGETRMVHTKSLKMGLQEIEAITQAFGMLPKDLLQRIVAGSEEGGGLVQVRKDLSRDMDFVDWTRNGNTLGYYTPDDRSITLLHMQMKPYHQLDAVGRQLWSDTVLHELGEALYESLSPRDRETFVSIYPWKTGIGEEDAAAVPASFLVTLGETALETMGLTPALPEKELNRHLLTHYSASNPRDLFCEAFMSYIAHGPEFREKAKASDYLQKLYDLFRDRFFTGPEGKLEYVAPVEASLAEVDGQIRRWRLEGTAQRQDLDMEEAHEEAKQNLFSEYILSPEATADQERADAAREEARDLEKERGYLGAYFAGVDLEAAGVKSPAVSEEESQNQDSRPWQDLLQGAISGRLKREFGSSASSEVSERFAERLLAFMSRGQRNRAINFLEVRFKRLARDGVSIDGEPEEIFDLIKEAAEQSLINRNFFWEPTISIFRRRLLPGQYSPEHLNALEEIIRSEKLLDSLKIRAIYEFLEKQKDWKLPPEELVMMTAAFADAYTSWGRKWGARDVAALLRGLTEEKLDIYDLQRKTKIPYVIIDTFAERFLSKEKYGDLLQRSELGNVTQQMQVGLAVQRNLEAQYRMLYSDRQPPEDLLSGIQRFQVTLGALQARDLSAVAQAKQLLGDTQLRGRVDELSRDLFRETQDRRDRTRRLPPKS